MRANLTWATVSTLKHATTEPPNNDQGVPIFMSSTPINQTLRHPYQGYLQGLLAPDNATPLLILIPAASTTHTAPDALKDLLKPMLAHLPAEAIDHRQFSREIGLTKLRTHYKLCMIFCDLTDFNSDESVETLARIKNQYCSHIKVFLSLTEDDSAALAIATKTLHSLGFHFTKPLQFNQKSYDCYSYKITNYNKKRDWNSPEYWANPQNFDRFRW